MRIPTTLFPMKSIDRKNLHQYYGNFDVNAKTVVDQMSDSLKGVVDNKVFSTTYRIAENPRAFDKLFDRFNVGWQWNTGTHIQLYDMSEFADKHGIKLDDPEVLSYTDIDSNRVYVVKLKNGNSYQVKQTPPLENPMESEVFKNTIGKAIITLNDNFKQIDKLKGTTASNRHSSIKIEYDPNTKSLNTEQFIEYNKNWMKSRLNDGEERPEGLHFNSIYVEGYLKRLETDLLKLIKEIL